MAATSNYLGTIEGKFSVDPDGGASYTIPLELPPGTAGLMPKLSLGYNSAAGNGMLGVGWSLQGLSAITRSPQTPAQDGVRGTITYSSTDRFALDGQRLMLVSGAAYDGPDAVYHTELESWQKVVPVYGSNRNPRRSGPDAFTVYAKDGKVLEYGNTPDSQVLASSTNPSVRSWCLNKITDLNGNFLTITYQYDAANNVNYPLSIDYTGNANAGLQPQRAVQFTYEARPDGYPRYQGGYPITTTQRMNQIQTYLDGELVRTYTLAYEPGVATGRSRIHSITEADLNGVALSPTVFTWQDGTPEVFSTLPPIATTASWQGSFLPMDYNGDGHTDLVNAYQNGDALQLTLFQSDGQRLSDGIVLPVTQIPYGAQLVPMDVNGDGGMDLVCASDNNGNLGLSVLLAQADQNGHWQFNLAGAVNGAGPSDLPWGGTLLAMDVDGDGLADLVYAYENNGTMGLAVLFSNGTSFARSSTDQTAPTVDYFSQAPLLPLDVNGDQMTDLVYAYQNGDNFAFTLFLSQGRNGFVQQSASPLPGSASVPSVGVLMPLDINSDGLGDIVQASINNGQLVVQSFVSNGVSFEVPPAQTFSLPNLGTAVPTLLPADVNGDGLSDLVVAVQNGTGVSTYVLQGTGSGFNLLQGVTQPTADVPWGGAMLPLDFAGTAKTALLFAYAANDTTVLSAMPAAGDFPDLLATITNGLGGVFNITYGPLTDPTIYTKNATQAPGQVEVCNLLSSAVSGATYQLNPGIVTSPTTPGVTHSTRIVDFPIYVVSSYSESDGRGSAYSFSYRYAQALLDLSGRGWLGFASVAATDWEFQATTQTQYNQPFPLTHAPDTITVSRSTDGALMRKTAFSYDVKVGAPNTGPNIQLVLPTSSQTDLYTFATPSSPVPDCTDLKTMGYDAFGNESTITETGSALGQPLFTFQTYANDPNAWRIGFLTEKKLTADSAGTQVLSWEKKVYDPATLNLTSHQLWNDQTSQWQATTYAYDPYGNQTSITDVSGAVTQITFDGTYHTFASSKSATPKPGTSLTWTYTYFPQFGVTASQTDPNGVTSYQVVDGLGRLSGTQGPDPTGKKVALTQISWAADATGTYQQTLTLVDWSGVYRWKREYLDGLSRLYRTASLGPDGQSTLIVDTSFNSRKQVVKQSLPYYEGSPPLFTENTYDNYGRLIQVVRPYLSDSCQERPGTLTTTMAFNTVDSVVRTEALGQPDAKVTQLQYATFNGKRLQISQTDAKNRTTTFNYDSLARLTRATDPLGIATCTAYDSLGRKTTVWQEKDGAQRFIHTFQHDDANRTLVHTDPKGTTATQVYDPLGRLTQRKVQPTSGSGMQPIQTDYTLDDPGHLHSQGRVSSVTLSNGASYSFDYDACGNQAVTTITLDGASYAFQKAYTPDRKVQTLTYPDGSVQTNVYTPGQELQSVSLAGKGAGSDLVHAEFQQINAHGLATQVTYSTDSQIQIAYDYDATGRLNAQNLSGPGGSPLAGSKFCWNDFSQILSIQDQVNPSNSQTFTYDTVTGRLIQASGEYPQETYDYDDGGNLKLKDGITYTADWYQVQQGTNNGQTVFEAGYDDNGNMTTATRSGVTTTYTYNADNQLVSAGTVTLSYDYVGRRLTKQISGGPTTYYLAPYYQVTVFPGGAKQHTIFVFGDQAAVASATVVEAGSPAPANGTPAPGVFYLYQDHLRNSVYQLDAQGTVQTTIRYRPFGGIHALQGADTVQQKFTGKEWDDTLSLYYFGARFYDPGLGRFITSDDRLAAPLDHRDALNRYCYVTNDPVNMIDPTGHSPWWEALVHFFVDVALTVAGIALLALTPFGGPASTVLGSTLLAAGVAGMTYDITTLVNHKDLSWKDWGIHLGIGAATGFVAGGFAAAAGAAVDAMAAAEEEGAFWAVGGAARIATRVVMGVVGGSGSFTFGTFLSNLAYHPHDLAYGLGAAALLGGLLGGLATGAGEALGDVFSSEVRQVRVGLREWELQGARPGIPGLRVIQETRVWRVLDLTILQRFLLPLPGATSLGLRSYIWGTWQPSW